MAKSIEEVKEPKQDAEIVSQAEGKKEKKKKKKDKNVDKAEEV